MKLWSRVRLQSTRSTRLRQVSWLCNDCTLYRIIIKIRIPSTYLSICHLPFGGRNYSLSFWNSSRCLREHFALEIGRLGKEGTVKLLLPSKEDCCVARRQGVKLLECLQKTIKWLRYRRNVESWRLLLLFEEWDGKRNLSVDDIDWKYLKRFMKYIMWKATWRPKSPRIGNNILILEIRDTLSAKVLFVLLLKQYSRERYFCFFFFLPVLSQDTLKDYQQTGFSIWWCL